MTRTVSIRTTVQPGGRVEVIAPGFAEGAAVDVVVRQGSATGERTSMLTLADSLPPGPRSGADWEEIERALREERDAWDR